MKFKAIVGKDNRVTIKHAVAVKLGIKQDDAVEINITLLKK